MICDLHEVDNCSYCTGVEPRFQSGLVELPAGFLYAQHPGVCGECEERFQPGEVITRPRYGNGKWIATCCNGYES